jgi:hypothetical protein
VNRKNCLYELIWKKHSIQNILVENNLFFVPANNEGIKEKFRYALGHRNLKTFLRNNIK